MNWDVLLVICLTVVLVTTGWESRRGGSSADLLGSKVLLLGITVFIGAQALLPLAAAVVVGGVTLAVVGPASFLLARRVARKSLQASSDASRSPPTMGSSGGDERSAALLLQLADEVDAEGRVRARRFELLKGFAPAAGLAITGIVLGSWAWGLAALGVAVYGWARVPRIAAGSDSHTRATRRPTDAPGDYPGPQREADVPTNRGRPLPPGGRADRGGGLPREGPEGGRGHGWADSVDDE